jgi:ribosomal protein S18 acetylase RimI-like enzyme
MPVPDFFSDFSTDALKRVSAENYFDSFTCFSVVPGVEVYQGEDMVRIASPGIPNWLTNTVLRCRLSADNLDTAIDDTLAYFHARSLIPYWRLCPGDLPSELEQRLMKKGLSLAGEQPAMTVDLEKLNQDIRPPVGLTIERLVDSDTLKEKHGWIRQFGQGKSLGTLIMDLFSAYGFEPDSVWQHYIGMLDRKPVSWASVFFARGVAGIYAVGTLPEARRQGIGSAITLQGLLDARERGYRIGVLQSSEMGYNVYRRLGFETCFKIKTYVPAEAQS